MPSPYSIRNISYFLIAFGLCIIIHESMHAFIALLFREYNGFIFRIIGFEVLFKTSASEREGMKWLFISGSASFVTLFLGYILFTVRDKIAIIKRLYLKAIIYWSTIILMLSDALNLSIGSFIYGGDINGVTTALHVNQYTIQAIFFIIFLLNRELVAQKFLPVFGIKTDHPLFRPWMKIPLNK